MGHVANGREQRGVDHCCAGAEQCRTRREPPELRRKHNPHNADRLEPHSAGDKPLASQAVRECSREELTNTPHGRVDGGEPPNVFE